MKNNLQKPSETLPKPSENITKTSRNYYQITQKTSPKHPENIHIRLRACRRPSIFSPAESAPPPNVRDALFSLLQGADPLDPKAPQGPHPHPNPPKGPKGTQRAQGEGGQGNPRGPKGPKGTRGVPRGPKGAFGALGGDGPMGPFGVIPKPFRMECHFEWKVITKGNPLRNESRG